MILGIDLYLVGILIFGMRIFQNLAAIRHLFLKKIKNFYKKQEKRLLMLNVKCQWF